MIEITPHTPSFATECDAPDGWALTNATLTMDGDSALKLAPTDAQAWAWYLAANESVKSMLCLTIAAFAPLLRTYATGAAIWFATQATDELTNGNLFAEHQWEYVLLAVFAVVLWLIQKRTT